MRVYLQTFGLRRLTKADPVDAEMRVIQTAAVETMGPPLEHVDKSSASHPSATQANDAQAPARSPWQRFAASMSSTSQPVEQAQTGARLRC